MITEKKPRLYEEYKGLLEAYVFKNGDIPNNDFDLMDWSLIDELLGSVILLSTKKTSKDFKDRLQSFIVENTDNKSVIQYLERLAEIRLKYQNI